MKISQIREGVFKMRFKEIYGRYQKSRLTCEEAAELLGVSVKTFYRKRKRYEEEDFDGRFDRRLGKVSPHRAADREVEKVTRLYNEHYIGFSVKHFYEFAKREHNVTRSYNWTRKTLQKQGIVKKSTRGGKHRKRRERRPMEGMMLHQDGSTHQWIPALDYNLDLIVTMDDATSKITSAFLIKEEGTESTFMGLQETIKKYGLFCSLYTDRGSHYFYTPKAGEKVDKNQLTQVGRALKQLRIEHIAAYSPEARGRSERVFSTLQNRLPKELKHYGIETIEEANKYIREIYIPRHNEQFGVPPKILKSAYVTWDKKQSLKDILCVEEERTVQHDNTVRYNKLILQIPKNEFRYNYIKTKVKVHKYIDKSLAIFHGHMCIGKYDEKGQLQNKEEKKSKKRKNCCKKKRKAKRGAINF